MSVTMTKTQQFKATIEVLNAAGQPALFDGPPVWTASDPAALKLNVASDGMSADVIALGPEGAFSVKVEVDADKSAGIKLINTTLDVTVEGGTPPVEAAVEIRITASTPTEQP